MKHGDLIRDGDEFNREPWYWCAVCERVHGRDVADCDGLRVPLQAVTDPYGVPTGVVPRVETSGYLQEFHRIERAMMQPLADVVQKVVDDYLLMERKARAWDTLYAKAMRDWDQNRLADMDALL